jgi:hypothetical protein
VEEQLAQRVLSGVRVEQVLPERLEDSLEG